MSLVESIALNNGSTFSRLAGADKRRSQPKPSFCPICGALVEMVGGHSTKPFHIYYCRNLRVCFCDDCVSGQGGVDIICRVIEATPETRKMVEKDCCAILDARRKQSRETVVKWIVGIGVVVALIGVCCLIWTPEDVFGVIGIILMLFLVGFLQGAVRR